MARTTLLIAAALGCGSSSPPQLPAQAPAAVAGYLKGQLHVHSRNSGDSETPPARVASWYQEHGFDFIVFTDHNRITTLPAGPLGPKDLIVIPGVELTQNVQTCDPPPANPALGCLLHVNALFVSEATPLDWEPPPGTSRRYDLYASALETTRMLGGIAQLNHPNFHWGADATLITELARHGLRLFEVANESSDVANDGDAEHPSTEAIWDSVLTAGATLYGTATDDAHYYDDADAARARGIVPDTGDHGWVMVHAARDVASIRDALARGDFYSSTGVTLRRIERTRDALVIEGDGGDYEFTFIGTGGKILARSQGASASYPLASAVTRYIRVDVRDASGRRAWVQPIWLP